MEVCGSKTMCKSCILIPGKTTGTVNDGRIDLLRKNTSRLPSLNIIYTFSDKNQVRAAYSKTLNRPRVPGASLTLYYMDMMTYRLAYGNENMKIQTDIDTIMTSVSSIIPVQVKMITAGSFTRSSKTPSSFTTMQAYQRIKQLSME